MKEPHMLPKKAIAVLSLCKTQKLTMDDDGLSITQMQRVSRDGYGMGWHLT